LQRVSEQPPEKCGTGNPDYRWSIQRKRKSGTYRALTGKTVDVIYAGFQFFEDGSKVISCPMGYALEKTTYYPGTGMCRALFAKECCENCSYKNECKGKPQKKNYAVHVSANMAERAQYIQKLSTEE